MKGPRFVHDCKACRYLGTPNTHDLYVCGDTLLARASDDPSDYASMLTDIVRDWKRMGYKPASPELLVALELVSA